MKRTLLLAALLGAAAAPAGAQAAGPVQSNTSGVLLGIGIDATTVHADDPAIASGTKTGGGIVLQLGYGFTPHFTLYTELAGASLSDNGDGNYTSSHVGIAHLDLGGRYHFGGPRSRLRPFLQAAVGVRAVTHSNVDYEDLDGETRTDALSYTGGAVTVGAGVLYFFKSTLSLHAGVEASGGKFTTFTIGDISEHNQDIQATSGRVNVGLNWFPSIRR